MITKHNKSNKIDRINNNNKLSNKLIKARKEFTFPN